MQSEVATAVERGIELRAELEEELAIAQHLLEQSEGKVPDESTTRDRLAVGHREARKLHSDAPHSPDHDYPTVAQAERIRDNQTRWNSQVTVALAQLQIATQATTDAVTEHSLATAVLDLEQAHVDLAMTTTAARDVLSATTGNVNDDSVRDEVAAAIETAEQMATADLDGADLEAIWAATAARIEHTAALTAATNALTQAQAAWHESQGQEPTTADQPSTPTSTGADTSSNYTRQKSTNGGRFSSNGNGNAEVGANYLETRSRVR